MLLDRYITFTLSHRWQTIVLATLAMLAITAGARFVTVTNDYKMMFGEDNPQLLALENLESTYSESNAALIAIAPREGSVFSRQTLAAIEEFTEVAWRAPYSVRVDSLTNYFHSRASGDDIIVEPLVDGAQSLTDADLIQIRSVALDAPDIARRLISDDERVSGLAINFALPDDNPGPAWHEIADYLEAAIAQAQANHPHIDYYLTGDIIMHPAFAKATEVVFETIGPLVLLMLLAVTALLLRSLYGTLAVACLIIFVTNTALGIAGWLETQFTPASSIVPIIVMTFAVAYSIHIVTATLGGMSRGLSRSEAITEAVRKNAYPVFLTTITTMIGFLSLNASESPPFRVVGNLVATGSFFTFVYAMTFLPAMLSVLPLRARPIPTERAGFFDHLGIFVVSHRKVLLWSLLLVTVALVTGIPRNEPGDNWTKYFDESYEFRRNTDFVLENLTGLDNLEYSLKAGYEGGITDPEYLRSVDAFAEWFREQPKVSYVQAFPDIMKRLNKNMHGDAPAYYRLPDDPELAAQYLLLYELSLPFGRDLNDRIDVSKSATRMTVALRGLSSLEQRELDARAQAWLRANAPSLVTEASGLTMVFAHLSERNINSMLSGTLIAMALISFILIGVFKSVRIGLISLVPNFIPAAMSFGLWGYLVGNVSLAASVVTAVAFGVIVDDTIHFLTRYQQARREGLPASEAVQSTFRKVGRALWTTTGILSAGFLMFTLSGFQSSWVLGVLMTITIVLALLADFFLLPALLMAMDRKSWKQEKIRI